MNRRNPGIFIALLFSCLLPFAAQAASTPHWVHYKWLQGPPTLPKKVVVLPADIEVVEVTAGGVSEEVPEWSAEAQKNVLSALSSAIKTNPSLQEVGTPRLSKRSTTSVEEHMALYELVVSTVSDLGWAHKMRRFDYSIGPGLKELRKKTGADAAILVYGQDEASTAGRKAKAVAGNIPVVNMFTGPPPELGHSFIHIGLVDLRSGDILWMNSEYREGTSNLREYEDASEIIAAIFDWYPGIERYRKVYVD